MSFDIFFFNIPKLRFKFIKDFHVEHFTNIFSAIVHREQILIE